MTIYVILMPLPCRGPTRNEIAKKGTKPGGRGVSEQQGNVLFQSSYLNLVHGCN